MGVACYTWNPIARPIYSHQSFLLKYYIDLEPNNHVNYFRRATAYLSIGRNELAIKDFDAVLSIKQDNHHARLKRAMLLLYQGAVDECLEDLQVYSTFNPQDVEAMGLVWLGLRLL